ncbi:NAD-dependent epimerase/dehydratase family protein [Alicyclobacillus cycloheptanicus]|uniref:UDP-glucose 4-epimerase n=1 Tax=Alicyclobacillus cycloheptanicus TaxID=1457 RepID=A0ABT9XGD7_9BACL|nr:NAD-dependent epimerase/dehydratase family protein [Alicyclobacillus cycloheptanicus]MDQ0189242.1 UDP-glucose 4-epimerase [Alicyclobacillus cycloheptanicus]WDM00426.1 NAD-dependent epimerase/dehydratase family protein [Alicyclobacillus cycloheptanicus]
MKVLVTGGSGLIGTATTQALLAEGHDVVNVDREPTRVAVRHYNLDVADAVAVREIFEKEHPDAVLHLAAQISVPSSVADPLRDMHDNIQGALSVFEAARHTGTRRVVLASSAAVYGNGAVPPITEEVPLEPNSPYGVSKVAGELYLRGFYREFFTYAVLRYGNVYGPQQSYQSGAVIAKMVHDALTEQCIHVDGDGTQERDFVHVRDVAHLNVLVLTNPQSFVANVGSGRPVQIMDIVRVIREELGQSVTVQHHPTRPGDIHASYYDAARIQRLLQWKPSISLREGIRQVIEAQRR